MNILTERPLFARTSGMGVVAAATTFALCAMTSTAVASNGPLVTLEWFGSADQQPPELYTMSEESDKIFENEDGSWNYQGSTFGSIPPGFSDPTWELSWDITALSGGGAASGNGNRFVTADLTVTNTTSQYQSFWALVTVTLDDPIIGGTLMSGGVVANIADNDNQGAELRSITSGSFAGDPIYQALIDGAPQQDLWTAPFSLNAAAGSTNSLSTSFGTTTPEFGPDAMNTISVWLKIEVSPQDQATVFGFFEIAAAVPAPAGLPLLAALGLTFCGRRRRSS